MYVYFPFRVPLCHFVDKKNLSYRVFILFILSIVEVKLWLKNRARLM